MCGSKIAAVKLRGGAGVAAATPIEESTLFEFHRRFGIGVATTDPGIEMRRGCSRRVCSRGFPVEPSTPRIGAVRRKSEIIGEAQGRPASASLAKYFFCCGAREEVSFCETKLVLLLTGVYRSG